MSSAVDLHGVTKAFGATRALDQVSLTVEPGELVALLGGSGCGKTTLLRVVAGLTRPDGGRVRIGDREVTTIPTRHRPIGMVFQHYALFPNLDVAGNVAFPLTVRRRRPSAEVRRRTGELLELVGLAGYEKRYPNELSGGQQQRVALARALAPEPEVLLLDEPLSALDAVIRVSLRDEIRRIQQRVGTTALFVTHDQSEAMAIADRVAVMAEGRIEEIATPPEIWERPASRVAALFVGARTPWSCRWRRTGGCAGVPPSRSPLPPPPTAGPWPCSGPATWSWWKGAGWRARSRSGRSSAPPPGSRWPRATVAW